jgi:5-methylcytosine-specific restriction endonuclease McrA
MLTVARRGESRKGGTYWICKCQCGNTKTVLATHLKRGLIRSCGCFRATRLAEIYAMRTVKPCGKCKTAKSISEFYVDKSRGDGLAPKCKPCLLAANKASEERNKERVRQRNKAKWQRRYQANREKFIKKAADYQKTPNGRLIKRAAHLRRRARERNAPGTITAAFLRELYQRQDGKCACCCKELNGDYHIDHIIPLAKGGTNEPHNIQLLTPTCNIKKGARLPYETFVAKGKEVKPT